MNQTDPWVDAAPVRVYLERLASRGIGLGRVSEATGLHVSRVRRLRAGTVTRVRESTAAAVLAVVTPAPGAVRPPSRARVLLHWFLKEGFTLHSLAQRLGLDWRTVACRRKQLRIETEAKLSAFHRMLTE